MTECYSTPLWHVAYTEPRAERDVCEDIGSELRFQTFLPFETRMDCVRGRWIKIARPLFPRYIFVQVYPYQQEWQEILGIQGVIDILMASDDVPGYVPTATITALRKAETFGMFDQTTKFPKDFAIGETVRISDGQFCGHNGIIAEFMARMRSSTARKRAKLLVEFMGRAIMLDLPVTSLEKV